ncbi:hypothetical protein OHB00_08370 [Streptomyces sp. NBC_00631]|uniref:hypothetical protein n=1 Tax=Streptomyces sp. NBC_00631 TaxID=2975793 RepID=UPI0030DE3F70
MSRQLSPGFSGQVVFANGRDQRTQRLPRTVVTLTTAGLDHPTIRSDKIRHLIRRRATWPHIAGFGCPAVALVDHPAPVTSIVT